MEQYGEAKLLEMLGADLSVPLVPVEWNPPVEAGQYMEEDEYEQGGYTEEPQYAFVEFPPAGGYSSQQLVPPAQQRSKKRTPPPGKSGPPNGGPVRGMQNPWGGAGPYLNFPPGPVSTLGLLAMQSGARVQTGAQLQPSLEHGYIVRTIPPPQAELPPTVIQPQVTRAQPPPQAAGPSEELFAAANKVVNEYRLPEYLTGEGGLLFYPSSSMLPVHTLRWLL